MNLRERLLKAYHVKPRDLKRAVEDARALTEDAEAYAGIAENVLSRLSSHPKLGKRTREVVVVAAKVAATMRMAAGDMLAHRGRAADGPHPFGYHEARPRAPQEKEERKRK